MNSSQLITRPSFWRLLRNGTKAPHATSAAREAAATSELAVQGQAPQRLPRPKAARYLEAPTQPGIWPGASSVRSPQARVARLGSKVVRGCLARFGSVEGEILHPHRRRRRCSPGARAPADVGSRYCSRFLPATSRISNGVGIYRCAETPSGTCLAQ